MYQQIKKAFEDRGVLEIINWNPSEKQLRVTGRVSPKDAGAWKATMQLLLDRDEGDGWRVDISRFYFLRNDKLFYAWRVIFQGDIKSNEKVIASILRKKYKPTFTEEEPEEYDIPIYRPAVNWKNGKGGFPIGTQPLIFSRPTIT